MITIVISYKMVALFFAVICLILTAFLLIWPNAFLAANRVMKKWVSTDSFEQKLNQTHDIDESLLRWRKVIGVITLVLTVVFVVILFR